MKFGPMTQQHKDRIAASKRATPEVIWSKVDKRGDDECWPWNGYTNEQGYGRTWIDDKGYYAHRVIFNLHNPGVITLSAPKSKYETGWLRHSCDNPPCCNPKHLLVGTHDDNMKDKVARNRQTRWGGGVRSPRAKLSAEDVRIIRLHKRDGATIRALALLYEVSRSAISHCVYGRSYQDVI